MDRAWPQDMVSYDGHMDERCWRLLHGAERHGHMCWVNFRTISVWGSSLSHTCVMMTLLARVVLAGATSRSISSGICDVQVDLNSQLRPSPTEYDPVKTPQSPDPLEKRM